MKVSRVRQAVSGLAIPIAIAITLLCGVVLAAAESQSPVSERLTPTVYHIPTIGPSSAPSSAPTVTPSPTAPATLVIIPTSTPAASALTPTSWTPTLTLTAIPPTQKPIPTRRTACSTPAGWQTYRVQHGDTLYVIAYRYGITLTALMDANCLTDTHIVTAATIFVPPVTPRPFPDGPVETDPPTDPPITSTQTSTDGACTDPDSVITSPKVGSILKGNIKIIGTARLANFDYYKIQIRQEGTGQQYSDLTVGHQQIDNGLLAELDTSIFPNGEFWLRLVVVDATGNYPERCAILVTLSH